MPLNVSIKDSGDIMVEMMEAHLKSFMHSKIIKKKNKLILNNYIKKIFGIIVIVLIILYFIPIKFVIKSSDLNFDDEFYIVKFIPGMSTDSGWYIVGDQNNMMYSQNIYIDLIGKKPTNFITTKICANNQFIIYGTLEKNQCIAISGYEYTKYTLNCEYWEILDNIKEGTHENYLTLYDLKWVS